jgi:hypothetical protein
VIDVRGLKQPDILDYLHPEVVKRYSNADFVDWKDARSRFDEFKSQPIEGAALLP